MPKKYKNLFKFEIICPDMQCTHKNKTFDTHIAIGNLFYVCAIDSYIRPIYCYGAIYGIDIVGLLHGNMGIKSFVFMSTLHILTNNFKFD